MSKKLQTACSLAGFYCILHNTFISGPVSYENTQKMLYKHLFAEDINSLDNHCSTCLYFPFQAAKTIHNYLPLKIIPAAYLLMNTFFKYTNISILSLFRSLYWYNFIVNVLYSVTPISADVLLRLKINFRFLRQIVVIECHPTVTKDLSANITCCNKLKTTSCQILLCKFPIKLLLNSWQVEIFSG